MRTHKISTYVIFNHRSEIEHLLRCLRAFLVSIAFFLLLPFCLLTRENHGIRWDVIQNGLVSGFIGFSTAM